MCNHAKVPISEIPDPSGNPLDQLIAEEERSAQRQRIDPVLLPDDEVIRGITAIAKQTPWSRQRLNYAIKHYPEFAFVWQEFGAPLTMQSSIQDVCFEAIETRIHTEQVKRGETHQDNLKKRWPEKLPTSKPFKLS